MQKVDPAELNKMIRFEVLDSKRRRMLPKLEFLRKEHSFYLAGGTALALQIGHRTSLDFDFYSKKEFKNDRVLRSFRTRFNRIRLIQNLPDTLIVKADGVEISLFYYWYPLLKSVVRTPPIDLASKEDIAAMKLIAIVQRGTARDFIDLYFLLEEFSLQKIFRWTKKKFPPFNPYLGLRALTYFQDAEKDLKPVRFRLLKSADWGRVKETIVKRVVEFKREALGR